MSLFSIERLSQLTKLQRTIQQREKLAIGIRLRLGLATERQIFWGEVPHKVSIKLRKRLFAVSKVPSSLNKWTTSSLPE